MPNPLNILVTGANGFVGRHLIARLRTYPQYEVFGLDHRPGAAIPLLKPNHFFEQNIAQSFQIHQNFDAVIHLAALNVTHVGQAAYEDYVRVNVDGTANLLKAVACRHFIFVSTAKVYLSSGRDIDEQSPLDPQGDYARSKLAAEEVVERLGKNRCVTIVRPVNIVGPGQAEKALLPVLFAQAWAGQPLNIFAPQETRLQLLALSDLLEAFDGLLNITPSRLEKINLSGLDAWTLFDIASEVIRLTGSTSTTQLNTDRAPAFSRVSSAKAKALLGWEARLGIKNILQDIYEASHNQRHA